MTQAEEAERTQVREAIQFHYDVGNRFYELWLDERMVYSCALWDSSDGPDDLETAQLRKLDYHLTQAKASEAGRLLEVGCGWGALLARCEETNPRLRRAVGLTLSEAQQEYIRERHSSPRIECRLEDWHDHRAESAYDSIVSIGAFEHFAAPEDSRDEHVAKYREFFAFCNRNLNRAGYLSLQTIAYLNMRREDASQFINSQIFPHSDLPYLDEIVQAAAGNLELVAIRNDRLDYARTSGVWARRLKAKRSEAVAASSEGTVNRYLEYLQLSTVGFLQAKLCLLRITARKL